MGRSLREVRIALQARLGYGAVDQPALTPILNSFLSDAQEQLYSIGWYKHLEMYWDLTVGAGSANVAYPAAAPFMEPDKIREVRVNIGTVGSPSWQEVKEGVTPGMYSDTSSTYPRRYERRDGEFEFSPATRDKSYTARVFGMRKLNQLRDDDDTFDVPDNLVFNVALGAAKEHYRHPDAKSYLGKAASILASAKWANAGPKLIRPCDKEEDEVEPKPVVV
jgi:hypothetical protein